MQALIFDFDGTILDTETPEYEAWRTVYHQHDCELPLDQWTQAIGKGREQNVFDPYAYLEAAVGRPLDRDALRTARRAHYLAALKTEPVRPGVREYLDEAQRLGLALGVASSSDHAWVEGHLARLGLLSFFAVVRCAEDVAHTKPFPDLYLSALHALGASAAESVAFEDSPNGAWAAKRAGLFCVAVPNTMTRALNFDHADLRLGSLVDLPFTNLLERVSAVRPMVSHTNSL